MHQATPLARHHLSYHLKVYLAAYQVRAQSLYSLGELRDATSAPTVLAGTADPSGLVRHAAVCAACRLGAASAVPYVTRALQRDDNERVRAAAAGALYLLQTVDSLRALLDALLASADSEIVTRGIVAQHVESAVLLAPHLSVLGY